MSKKPSKKPKIKVDYERVENLAGRGLTKEQIARCLGMHPATLFRRQKDDERFLEAMKNGEAAAIAAVTGELLKNIKVGNVTAIIFYLKCRAGWKETTVLETRDAPPVPADICTDAEAEEAYHLTMRGKE